jgi:hypothetical protein
MASGGVEQMGFNWGLLLTLADCIAFWLVLTIVVMEELS